MTATDTHNQAHDAVMNTSADDALYQLFASNDHKMVGRRFVLLSLLMGLLVAAAGALGGFERASLDDFGPTGSLAGYFQAWTFVRSGGIFLVAMPLLIGIGIAIVPLQVGAPSIAFPRLAAASFWGWLIGSGIHVASFLADGGFGPAEGTSIEATRLTITSLGMVIFSLLAASVCLATTVIALRPAGMSLMRVPMFSWSMLVAASVWLLSLPVLAANLVLIYADLQGRAPIEFGQPDHIWGQVAWAFQAPQILAFAIPVLGIAADIVPPSARTRQAQRSVIQTLIGLFGAVSFGAWAQTFFSRGADPAFVDGKLIYEEFLYAAFAVAALGVVFAAFGGVIDNIRRGQLPKLSMALAGSVLGLFLLLDAALIGALRVLPFLDILHDDHVLLVSTSAQFKLVLAAVIASAVGALGWWSPNIFGGYAKEGLGMMAVLAAVGAGIVGGVPDLITAFMGQPDISVASMDDVGALNGISAMGMVMLFGAVGALFVSVLEAFASTETLPDDPWDAHTLEWAAPSPPPIGNFVEPIGMIESAEPLLDELEEVS